MNRLTLGTVVSLTLLLLAGCSSEPTDDLRNGIDKLVAEPAKVTLAPGGTKTVEVGAVDAQGNQLSDSYEITNVGAGITVRRDSTFLPIFVNDSTLVVPPTGPRFRFVVTAASGTSFQNTSFQISASGKSIDIPVNIEPTTSIEATFSNATPALGEVVTLTMPPGLTLTPTATVSFADESMLPVIVSRAPDGTSISFIVPPNRAGPLRVNGVVSAVAPSVVFAPTTALSLTAPQIDSIDVVFSTTTPTVGQTVTATLPPLMKFAGTDSLPAPAIGIVPATFLPIQGQVSDPIPLVLSADSTSATFDAPPNALGVARVDSVVVPGGFVFSFPTRAAITAPNIGDTVDVTFSTSTPALGELVTATAPPNFRFSADNSAFAFGTKIGAIQDVAADSASLTFIALPGTVSNAVVSGLRYTPAPEFLVTLPNRDSIVTAEITPLPNADDPKTAPALTVPAPGGTTTLFDAGPFTGASECCFGGPTRLYKLVVTETMTLTFTLDWYEGQDLGIYPTLDGINLLCPDDFSCVADGADHPEVTSPITFAPGTYFIAIPNFDAASLGGADPNLFKLTIDRS